MNLQNLLKQFGNMPAEKPQAKAEMNLYPESFNTVDLNQQAPKCNCANCARNNEQHQPESQNSPFQNILGQNSGLSSLFSLFSMMKGKNNMGSLLSSDNLPSNLKNLAPLINMFSKNDNKEKEEIVIDKFKRIEE